MPTLSSKLAVYHDIGSGKHRQLINLSDLAVSLGEDCCATLLGMYVFSGEDCTSAYKRKNPWKSWRRTPGFIKRTCNSVRNGTSSITCWISLEFTCLMYGQNRESSMDGLRAKLLRKIVGEDEKLLPNLRSTWLAFLPASLLWSHTSSGWTT